MTYCIRTINGVQKISKTQYDFLMKKDYGNITSLAFKDEDDIGYHFIEIKDIIGEPIDDIRKIVDLWVCIDKTTGERQVSEYRETFEIEAECIQYEIKGGIWTDYGLKFITNYEGE